MNRNIDFKTMRKDLEFSFRVISSTGRLLESKHKCEFPQMIKSLSAVSEALIAHIYLNRFPSMSAAAVEMTPRDAMEFKTFLMLINEEFLALGRRAGPAVGNSTEWGELTANVLRQDVIIKEGCDRILETIKKVFFGINEKQEAWNGQS